MSGKVQPDEGAAKNDPKKEPILDDVTPPEESRADSTPGLIYSPLQGFLICLGLVMLPLALAWDLRYGPPEALIATYQPVIAAYAGDWLSELLIRTASDPARLALVIWLMATLLYGVVQSVVSTGDQRIATQSEGEFGGFGRAFRWISGRRSLDGVPRYLIATTHYGGDRMLSPLRFGFAAFPMVGFLGTIVGLSGAIARLPDAVADKELLGPVLDELFVAFDTTFLGLLGAIICLVFIRIGEDQVDETARKLS